MSVTGLSVDDTAIFITPICEECMKLMPLLFYFLVFCPKDNSLLASAVAVGVGFATFENCCYLLSGETENLSYILIRGFAVGVMHIMCAVGVGFGLIFMTRVRHMAAVGALGILALTVTFHAVCNLLVSVPGISQSVSYSLPLLTAFIGFIALSIYKKQTSK